MTPASRHRGDDEVILSARKEVHIAAKAKHPERWSGEIKNLESVGGVWLNPDEVVQNDDEAEEKVA